MWAKLLLLGSNIKLEILVIGIVYSPADNFILKMIALLRLVLKDLIKLIATWLKY